MMRLVEGILLDGTVGKIPVWFGDCLPLQYNTMSGTYMELYCYQGIPLYVERKERVKD